MLGIAVLVVSLCVSARDAFAGAVDPRLAARLDARTAAEIETIIEPLAWRGSSDRADRPDGARGGEPPRARRAHRRGGSAPGRRVARRERGARTGLRVRVERGRQRARRRPPTSTVWPLRQPARRPVARRAARRAVGLSCPRRLHRDRVRLGGKRVPRGCVRRRVDAVARAPSSATSLRAFHPHRPRRFGHSRWCSTSRVRGARPRAPPVARCLELRPEQETDHEPCEPSSRRRAHRVDRLLPRAQRRRRSGRRTRLGRRLRRVAPWDRSVARMFGRAEDRSERDGRSRRVEPRVRGRTPSNDAVRVGGQRRGEPVPPPRDRGRSTSPRRASTLGETRLRPRSIVFGPRTSHCAFTWGPRRAACGSVVGVD